MPFGKTVFGKPGYSSVWVYTRSDHWKKTSDAEKAMQNFIKENRYASGVTISNEDNFFAQWYGDAFFYCVKVIFPLSYEGALQNSVKNNSLAFSKDNPRKKYFAG